MVCLVFQLMLGLTGDLFIKEVPIALDGVIIVGREDGLEELVHAPNLFVGDLDGL